MRRSSDAFVIAALLGGLIACKPLIIRTKAPRSGGGPSAASGPATGSGTAPVEGGGTGVGGPAGSDSASAPQPLQVSLNVPKDHILDGSLLYSMIEAFNTGVGRDVLTLPLENPTSDVKWAGGGELGTAFCQSTPINGTPSPAFDLRLNSDEATRFLADPLGPRKLTSSSDYLQFARCLGLGLGLAASADPDDVMGPTPASASPTKLAAFYETVKALRRPR